MDLDTFFAHAIKLEQDAVETYEKLTSLLAEDVTRDLGAFFQEMTHYARLHLSEVRGYANFQAFPDTSHHPYFWGNQAGPESIIIPAEGLKALGLEQAIALAHDAESRAAAFYERAAQVTPDLRVTALACQFAAEEHGHMLALDRFLGIKPY